MRLIGNKNKNFALFIVSILLIVFSVVALQSIAGIRTVQSLPAKLCLSKNDLESIDIKNVSYAVKNSVDDDNSEIIFKLFNLFPIKTVKAAIEDERNAYLGGFPVGLSLKAEGVLVVKKVQIDTFAGVVSPQTEVEEGDIITQINSKKVIYVSDIADVMSALSPKDNMVEIKVRRDGAEKNLLSYPVKENLTGFYRLGLAVKDSIDGVGTVSYIKSDGRFGSLGHAIGSAYGVVPCYTGSVFKCKLLGYTKGSRGEPGELKGAFYDIDNPIGDINVNNYFGVFGNIKYGINKKTYEIGSRFQVKMGKAKICTTINDKPEFFDIEIIKSTNQSFPCEKGMILRVTDKTLLSQTGGILQGMSGSPIIQNNKIIGSVTHVLVSDPTKGYGIFLDWMYDN